MQIAKLLILLTLSIFSYCQADQHFDDTAWQSLVRDMGNPDQLNHYRASNLPLPMLDYFPENFLWGAAIAEFQNSGSTSLPDSNWAHFEKSKKLAPSNVSVDHWNNYSQDIALLQATNMNSFRFSIDWSSIQPTPDTWNEAAFKRYEDFIIMLNDNGITPMVTLHHFVHPAWLDKLGGFEKEENSKYFVTFAEAVFKRFHKHVRIWCTINEPAIYAMCDYVLGIHSPGNTMHMRKAGIVLKNLLKAHVEIYERLQNIITEKNLAHENHEIGIVHNVLKFTSRYWWDPVAQSACSMFTSIAHDPVMNALKNDNFVFNPLRTHNKVLTAASLVALASSYLLQKKSDDTTANWVKTHWVIVGGSLLTLTGSNLARLCCSTNEKIPGLSKSFDFVGLNYYASAVIGWNKKTIFGSTCFPHQVMGDMDLPVSDPDGFEKAIDMVAQLGKPIYLTETGCADANDDRRPLLLRESMFIVGEALRNGIDIRGYYHWTLMDNYEWHNGFGPKFGLYDKDRNPRASALWLRDFIEQVQKVVA